MARRLLDKNRLGKTDVEVPPIIFGTSCLGNLYQVLPVETKYDIITAWFVHVEKPVALDTAGKYGAGLALEVIGNGLRELGVRAEQVVISNKLGWFRKPLSQPEPSFEPGVWKNLNFDAEQQISYDGIMACWQQGCELLAGDFLPQVVSIHDPDEYIAQGANTTEKQRLFDDIIDGYRALQDLKQTGEVRAIGVGAKDWQIILKITREVALDWVMLAVSLTVLTHPPDLLAFIDDLQRQHISIINSAVFHSGFLTGGDYFDYRRLDKGKKEDASLYRWREKFHTICDRYQVGPSDACVRFGLSPPGVVSVALNSSRAHRVQQNVAAVSADIPNDFWVAMKSAGLISEEYPYLG